MALLVLCCGNVSAPQPSPDLPWHLLVAGNIGSEWSALYTENELEEVLCVTKALVDESGVVVVQEQKPAKILAQDEKSARFKCGNAYGFVHNHPGGPGYCELSEADRNTLYLYFELAVAVCGPDTFVYLFKHEAGDPVHVGRIS